MLYKRILILPCLVYFIGCASINKIPSSTGVHFIHRGDLEVPDIIYNTDWVMTDTSDLAKSNDEVIHSAIFYEYPDNNWYMSVHTIFGREVMRAYGIHDEHDNLLVHWYLLKIRNDWFLMKSSKINRYYPRHGLMAEITVYGEDKKALIKAIYYKH